MRKLAINFLMYYCLYLARNGKHLIPFPATRVTDIFMVLMVCRARGLLGFVGIGYSQGQLLLTWLNFNFNVDKQSHAQQSVGWNYSSIPKLQWLHRCLLSRSFGLFWCRSMKTSKLRVIGLCAGNSPGTGVFPTQMACNAENVSIWWRHHE